MKQSILILLVGAAAAAEHHGFGNMKKYAKGFDTDVAEGVPVPHSMERWRTEFHHEEPQQPLPQQPQQPVSHIQHPHHKHRHMAQST